MDDYNERFTSKITLHSNLVLFKFHFPSRVRLPLLFFTFQSGSIQIISSCTSLYLLEKLYIPIWFYSNYCRHCLLLSQFAPLHSNLVLFKYSVAKIQSVSVVLYIPIWFYSNTAHPVKVTRGFCLYIPIWFYSNFYSKDKKRSGAYFTFQSGSIQIHTVYKLPVAVFYTLHSNLVLFK